CVSRKARRQAGGAANALGDPRGCVREPHRETPSRCVNMRDSLKQLVLTRFREFVREPEALFWTLAFPILLTVGLGIAFRNRPPELVHVAVIGDSTAAAGALRALSASKRIVAERLPDDRARLDLRTG